MTDITVARPYAEALFKVADEKGVAKDWQNRLLALAAIAGNADFLAFSTHPKASQDDIIRLFESVTKQPLEEEFKHFIEVLFENKRLSILPEIALLFQEKVREKEKRLHALVESAYPLDKRLLDKIASWLKKKYGRTLEIESRINPELIGGIVVHIGDEMIDLSIKNSVEQIHHMLASG
jgi:F-type H+-transporting ATPase subunit delta